MTTFDVGTSNTAYTTLAGMGFDVEILDNPDVAWHRATIHDWLVREAEVDLSVADPTDLHSGYNVLQSLEKAAGLEGLDRKEAVFKAYRKAQMLKYGRWARGEIKSKKEPMPEDVKEMLRARARPAIKDPHMVKSLAKSMGGIADQTDAKVSEIFHSVFGPTKPYGREVQERFLYEVMMEFLDEAQQKKVKHLLEQRKLARANRPKGRVPLYQDRAAQIEKEKAYPWIKPGSWRQDPGHAGSTILEILCQNCQAERTIHAGDAFQVRRCAACKAKNRSKGGADDGVSK